jgi:hypothetical protein
MNATAVQQPYEVPEGGLASFLTAASGSWSDDALSGIDYEIIRPAANELAEFGREGDNRIAHVADGETVIPMEVFEEDPALKEALFGRMREMGIDPERYVVGNELNSINPVTGQPEFFLKKLFKGIKKAVKGVVKVFKKIAPIVLSVGLNFLFPGLGAIASGALGSGIGTLVQGGNLKDAFKAALIGGAVGGISSGIGSVMKGGEFMAGVKGGLPTGMGGGVNPTLPGPSDLTSKISEGVPDYVAPATPGPEIMPPMPGADNVMAAAKEGMAGATTQPDILGQLQSGQFTTDASGTIVPKESLMQGTETATTGATEAATTGATSPAQDALITSARSPTSFFDKIKQGDFVDAFKGQRAVTKEQVMDALLSDANETLVSAAGKEGMLEALNAKANLILSNMPQPGMLAKYGPMAGLGLAGIGLAGGFKAQPMPEPYDFFGGMTREDYIRMYPERYGYTPIGRDEQGNLLPSRSVAAANGGDISSFPRKTGPIRGPGTETSDDIPAMLSDGEFVMTARAVRGAGNGSRKEGMNRMYQMMKNFEGSAARG